MINWVMGPLILHKLNSVGGGGLDAKIYIFYENFSPFLDFDRRSAQMITEKDLLSIHFNVSEVKPFYDLFLFLNTNFELKKVWHFYR